MVKIKMYKSFYRYYETCSNYNEYQEKCLFCFGIPGINSLPECYYSHAEKMIDDILKLQELRREMERSKKRQKW